MKQLALALLALSLMACRTFTSLPMATVCEINERPLKFDGREVMLVAEISAEHHTRRFTDRRCVGQALSLLIGEGANDLDATLLAMSPERITSGKFRGIVTVTEEAMSPSR